MSALPPEIEQSDAMLAEAAKADLVLMRHVQGLALRTDDPQEVATLTHAYARASRCMRQNLALLAKQKADRAKAAREADQHKAWLAVRNPVPERDLKELAYEERAQDLQDAVGRVISATSGGDRRLHADWTHRFDRELDDWSEQEDFVDEELDAHVLSACRALGLPEDLAQRWQDLPEPTFVPDPAPTTAETRPPAQPDAHLAATSPPADLEAPSVPWADSA